MDEILMLRGVLGLCPDCGDERILLPVDDEGLDLCCTDCDAAVGFSFVVAVSRAEERLAG